MSSETSCNGKSLLKLLSAQSGIPELKFCRCQCSIQAVGDGYMNVVYRVRDENNQADSVIVKQAPVSNKLSEICRDLDFDPNRGKIEYFVFAKFHHILPESVPKPYLYDEPSKTLVMEDLRNHVVLRKTLIGGDVGVSTLAKVTTILTTLHWETCQQQLGEKDFFLLRQKFANDTQTELVRQFTFVKPFCNTEPSNRPSPEIQRHLHLVYNDDKVLLAVQELQKIFVEKKQCLIHADLHTGSVMVHERSVKIIDTEFAHVGPAAADVGTYFAHLLFSYHAHRLYPKEEAVEFHNLIGQAIRDSLTMYLNGFRLQADHQACLLIAEIAGFTGLQLVRCIIGMAYTEDIEDKPKAEMACFLTGVRLLKCYTNLQTEEALMACLFKTCDGRLQHPLGENA